MNKEVGILHQSEIIRKGLSQIVRSIFAGDIRQFDKIEELAEHLSKQKNSMVLYIDNTCLNTDLYLKGFHNNPRIEVIAIKTAPNEESICENAITLQNNAGQIYRISRPCFEFEKNVTRSDDNNELTRREVDVLRLVAMGHSNKEIADKLFISVHTVITHRKNITEKLGIKSISGLTVYAIINQIIDTTNMDNLI